MTSWKDVLLGVLSGWVALGILSSVITRKAMSACSVSVTDSLRSQEGVIALLIAVAIGLLVWWFAKKSHREDFSMPESQGAAKYMSYETDDLGILKQKASDFPVFDRASQPQGGVPILA